MRIIIPLTLVAMAFGGCAKHSKSSSSPYRYRGGARYAQSTESAGDSAPAPASYKKSESRVSMDSEKVTGNYAPKGRDVTAERTSPVATKGAKQQSDRSKLGQRMIIYYGDLSIGVFDPEKSAERCMTLAKKFNGYLKSRHNNRMTVRIPAKRFFDFIQELEAFGKVTSRRVSSEDVTSRFVDLSMRLNNLIAARDRLSAIMAKATKVKDTLAIEKELTRVTGEIERIKGQLRFMGNLVSFATVEVRFYMRHGRHKYSGPAVKIQTPIQWIRNFDIITLFRN